VGDEGEALSERWMFIPPILRADMGEGTMHWRSQIPIRTYSSRGPVQFTTYSLARKRTMYSISIFAIVQTSHSVLTCNYDHTDDFFSDQNNTAIYSRRKRRYHEST
jgi:hypothetical protein